MAKRKNSQYPKEFSVVGDYITQDGKRERWDDALYNLAMASVREEAAKRVVESVNPYATSANQSLPNSFYNSRYSSNDYKANDVANKEEEDLQKNIFGNMDAYQRQQYANVFERGGLEAALEYANAINSGINQDQEFLNTLDSGKVSDALYRRDKLDPSQYGYYKQLANENGKQAADAYLNNYRSGYYDRKSEKEVEKKRVEDLTRNYINSPEYDPNTQMSDEERQRQEWLLNNTYDMDFNQAAERVYGSEMNDNEQNVYNYLANTQGKDKAEEYYQNIRRDLQRRATQTQKNKWAGYYDEQGKFHEGYAQKEPVGTTLYSILVSPAKGIEYLNQAGQLLTTGQINEDDIRNNLFTNSAKFGRSAVSQSLSGGWKFAYDVGTSMADFLFNMLLGNAISGGTVLSKNMTEAAQAAAEKITLGIMGTGAAADATLEAKDRGLSDTQAFALGTIAGAAEILTEKVSIETLLNPAKSMARGDLVKYIGKNFLAEGSEEVGSDIINYLADVIITGDRNEFRVRVQELMDSGMSEEEAWKEVFKEKALEMGYDFIAGAVSGGVMGAVGAGLQVRSSGKFANETDLNTDEGIAGLIETGLENDPESESYKLASRAWDKMYEGIESGKGNNLSDVELVGMLEANQEAQNAQLEASKDDVINYINESNLNLKKAAQTVFSEMYTDDIPVDEYVTAMTDYYLAGAENKDINSIDTQTDLSIHQIEAAYRAGQEEFANEGVSLRTGVQRNDGKNTGGAVSTVEEGTGSLGEGTGEAADREIAQIKTGERVTENKVDGGKGYTLEYTPVTGGETSTMAEVRSDIEGLGFKVVFTKGNIIHAIQKGNETVTTNSRGFYDATNKTIYVQADHPLYTSKQIGTHEATHDKIATGQISIKDVENRIAGKDLDELTNDYRALYYGTTLTDDQILEEIICDSMAGMNNFSGISTIQTEKYQPYFETIKAKTEESTNQANAPPSEYLKQKAEIEGIKEANKKTESTPKEAASRETRAYKLSAESVKESVRAEQEFGKSASMLDNTWRFSNETYRQGGRNALEEYLTKYSGLSKEDQKDILTTLDWGYNLAEKMAKNKEYESFGKWSQTGLLTAPDGVPLLQVEGANGAPIRSVVVPNDEYPLNIDFTTVCKKRMALDAVLNKLVSDPKINLAMLSEEDIDGINKLIKAHQFEIACGLCYVDAKRYKVSASADTFVNGKVDKNGNKTSLGWNDLVNSMLKKGVNASYFELATNHVTPLGALLSDLDDKDVNFKTIDKILKPHLDKNGKLKGSTTEDVKRAYLLKSDPSQRHLLDINDLISTAGWDTLKRTNPELWRLANAHGGQSSPKTSTGFTAYGNEIIKFTKGKFNFNKNSAYSVGGVRVQSFSDYVANMFFDYMQMFADMSARELPSHAYTKEPNYVKLFGMTGQRINMSLIFKGANLTAEQSERLSKMKKSEIQSDPEFKKLAEHAGLDENGNYIYEDESFPPETAFALRKDPRYKNCGTIAVGLSDAHIRKLLADPQIDEVIPYHASGVSSIIKDARNLKLYTDYTDQQNTRDAKGDKLGKGKEYDWYKYLKSANNENGLEAKEAADAYLKWCDDNGYTPKFPQFRYLEDGKTPNENYYKLIVDFRSYDNNGNFMPQDKVSMTFPKDFSSIVAESLKEHQQSYYGRLDTELSDEQGSLYSEVKKMLSEKGVVTEAKFSAEPGYEDNAFSEGDPIAQTDSDIRFSKEVRDKKTLNFLNNQKTIKTYRTFQKIGDGLYAPMNAMENGKLGYKSMLGKWEQATEAPELAVLNEKNGSYYFNLRSGNNTASGKGRTTKAAYNPYLHSSNLVFNDQFSAAYDRPNLVVAECEVPESEVTSGYHADKAKDSVGWLEWKSGKVANALRNKGIERKVMLSRWMKPVRILSNAEVAAKYKEALDGTDIKVPWNVVSPGLLSELEKVGVDIDYGYQSSVKASYEDKYGEVKFSAEPTVDSQGNELTKEQMEYFKNSQNRDENGNLIVMYHGTTNGGFTVFNKADDHISYFFTDNPDVAASYSGAMSIWNPDSPQSFLSLYDVIGDYTDGILEKTKDGYRYVEEGEDPVDFKTLKDVQTWFIDTHISNMVAQNMGSPEIYEVYLNTTNPYIVDTNGSQWHSIAISRSSGMAEKAEKLNKSLEEFWELAKSTLEPRISLSDIKDSYADLNNSLEVWKEDYPGYDTDYPEEYARMKELADIAYGYYEEGIRPNSEDDVDFFKTREIARQAYEEGYDSVIFENLYDIGGYGGTNEASRVVIVFNSNQIKSIDNKTPTENDDIRFSQEPTSYQDIAKENRQLKKDLAKAYKDIEKWKNELKISSPLQVRMEDITPIGRDLKKRFSSTMPIGILNQKLKEYGDYILNGDKDLTPEEYAANVKAKAMDIASDLINTSEEMIVEYPEYKEVQKYLMQGVTISDQDKADIPDFEAFRKANFGNVRIVNNGLAVDSAYEELSQKYPHLFPDDITSPSDQLIQMAEVADAIRPTKGNPFEQYGLDVAEIVEETANELINETAYGQLRATKPTFADKQAAKLKVATADLKAEVKDLKKENRKANRMIENLKEKRKADLKSPKNWKERQRRAKSKREAQAMRKRIERHVNALSTKLLKPTDARHITERIRDVDSQVERLRSVTAKVLSVINLESNFEYSESELTPKGNPKHAKKGEAGIPTKRTQAFRELKDQYEKIADDGELLTDEALKDTDGLLQDIINFDDTPIQNLGVEDLTKIYNCLRSLEKTLDLADKLLTIDRNMSDVAMNLVNDNIGKEERGDYSWRFMNNMSLGMLTPEAYFHRLGETGDQLFRMFRDAQDKNINYIDMVRNFFHDNINLNVNQTEKEMHTVKLGNKEVEMSSAALMELYVLSKRQQGLDHIMTGGIRLQEKTSKKGKVRTSVHPITHITQEQLDKAFSQLTVEQRKTADKLQEFISTKLSKIGNQASMDVYGYEKFTEENYWPINVNKEQLPGADVKAKDNMPSTVANKGMTKAVKPDPKTSVNIGSIFDTFLNHSVEMSEYAAYLATMSDLNRIRNFSYWGDDGIKNMKMLVNHVHGSQGAQYWQKLMSDVANGVKSDNKYFGGWMGKFKATAVGANLRVILQQPTAILRAASMIDPKYLAMGTANPLKGSKKAIEHSPIAKWKSWGYFDINTGRSLRDLIMGSETKVQKASELMMAGAGKADDFAWGILWNAVEAETKDKTNLKPGTKEYYDHCAERFAEIVDKTQVVDGVLQRSDILRNGDWAVKMATSFMGEPIKQYNQFMNALYDMRKNPSKASKRMMIRTGMAMVAAGMLNAVAKSMVDMFRHKERDKDYWEQFWTEMWGITGEEKNAGETVKNFVNGNFFDFFNFPGYIPLVKDLESVILGFDVERTDMSIFKDMVTSADKFMKSLNGSKETVFSAGINLLTQMGRMFGIPVSNLWRDTKTILLDQPFGNNPNLVTAYNYNKLWGNVSEDKARFIDLLYEAYKKGDQAAFDYIYDDLTKTGVSQDSLQSNFDNHLKMEQYGKKEGVSVEDLKDRYVFKLGKTQDGKNVGDIEGFGSYMDYQLNKKAEEDAKKAAKNEEVAAKAEAQNQIYESQTYKSIESSPLWSKATTSMQNEIDNKLYKLSTGEDENLQNQIDWAKSHYGVSESDWLLYTLARQIVNEQTNNGKGYNKEDKTKAAKMVGLTYAQVNDIEHATSNMKKGKK